MLTNQCVTDVEAKPTRPISIMFGDRLATFDLSGSICSILQKTPRAAIDTQKQIKRKTSHLELAGVCRPIRNDSFEHKEAQELHTYIPIQNSPVELKSHFAENKNVFICRFWRLVEMSMTPINSLFLTLDPPNYLNEFKKKTT